MTQLRTYDDVYLTNSNGKLYLHLDGADSTNETVTGASYFRVRLNVKNIVYPDNYPTNYTSCESGKWLTEVAVTLGPQYSLNDDDLKIEWDLVNDGIKSAQGDLTVQWIDNSGGSGLFRAQDSSSSPWQDSDCLENNWWRHGLRSGRHFGTATATVHVRYYNDADTLLGIETVADCGLTSAANTERSNGVQWIWNAPTGTSGRAVIIDTGDDVSGFPVLGVTSEPLQNMATTSGGSGDPHVTTFDGCKYTL